MELSDLSWEVGSLRCCGQMGTVRIERCNRWHYKYGAQVNTCRKHWTADEENYTAEDNICTPQIPE